MLPVILGGLVGVGVGYMVKKICDENECGIDEKIEEGLMAIEEWFDEKTVVLDNYLVSTKEENKYQVEEEINLDSLQHMKKKVYHDSFVDFVTLYEKIENVDFGKLEYQEIDFDSKKYGDETFDEIV